MWKLMQFKKMEEDAKFENKLQSRTLGISQADKVLKCQLKDVSKIVGEYIMSFYDDKVFPGVIQGVEEGRVKEGQNH